MAFFSIYGIYNLDTNLVAGFAFNYPFENEIACLILTVVQVFLSNLFAFGFLFTLVIKTLQIYSTLISDNIIHENIIIFGFYLMNFLFTCLFQTLEFVYITDIKSLAIYNIFHSGNTSFFKFSIVQNISMFMGLLFLICLQLKLEFDKKTMNKRTSRLAILLIICLFLMVFNQFNAPIVTDVLISYVFFIILPLLYIHGNPKMSLKLKKMFCWWRNPPQVDILV